MGQKNSFNKQELLSMANGDMFGQNNAKLPLEPMLMIDRILNISKEGGAYDACTKDVFYAKSGRKLD